MPLIPIPNADDDDGAFLFRVAHIVAGAVRRRRPSFVHVVKIDNWFGARWLHFAGNLREREVRHEERFLNVGLVLRGLGRFGEAAAAFRDALKLDPHYEVARTALADVTDALELQRKNRD